jgi:hypothetical protein
MAMEKALIIIAQSGYKSVLVNKIVSWASFGLYAGLEIVAVVVAMGGSFSWS